MFLFCFVFCYLFCIVFLYLAFYFCIFFCFEISKNILFYWYFLFFIFALNFVLCFLLVLLFILLVCFVLNVVLFVSLLFCCFVLTPTKRKIKGNLVYSLQTGSHLNGLIMLFCIPASGRRTMFSAVSVTFIMKTIKMCLFYSGLAHLPLSCPADRKGDTLVHSG